ncbi:hypothetical protein [Mastigocoleus testarum]|uniref:hypothetical protein n=1 Tax=Mastigocoleus testarum TaxID=996925 RepID=UPI0013795AA4|nr:hypothetical protein [Mastigocoleus testarum]
MEPIPTLSIPTKNNIKTYRALRAVRGAMPTACYASSRASFIVRSQKSEVRRAR